MNGNLQPVPKSAVVRSPQLTLRAGADGTIREINLPWAELLGWSEPELRGRKLIEFVHPDDLAATREALGCLAEGGAPSVFVSRLRRQDGSYRWIWWMAVIDGQTLHATGHDVTRERQALDSLRASAETVRHLQQMESIGQLTRGITHNFNNLMQGIVGGLELTRKLIERGRLAETERFITGAIGSAQRAAALNQRVLDLSRQQPPDPRPLKFDEVIVGMEDVLRQFLPQTIKLVLDLSADLWTTHCDPRQAETALLNLFLNAYDALPDGGTIVIHASNADTGDEANADPPDAPLGQHVRIIVTASGPGLGKAGIPHAGGAVPATDSHPLGPGRRLAMVHDFALRNGGRAGIRGDLGDGTPVMLCLPRYVGEAA